MKFHHVKVGSLFSDPEEHKSLPTNRLPHVWDDEACCIHCGADGAEIWHLTKFCGYETEDSDRFCSVREDKVRYSNKLVVDSTKRPL